MSTRCNIVVKKGGKEHQYYHHCDGFPTGVGYDLAHYFRKEFKGRNGDEELSAFNIMKKLSKENNHYEFEHDYINLHGDIEYLYVIEQTEELIKLTCYEYDNVNDWDCEDINNYKPIYIQREVCNWLFYFKSWRTWHKEGLDKLKENLK